MSISVSQAARPDAPGLAATDVSFGYGSAEILRKIDLTVAEGEFVCLLGPSGSGKTTLLRLLAGLENPTTGSITWQGATLPGPGVERGVVFQDYSLYPWLTLADNIAMALEKSAPTASRRDRRELAIEYLGMVGLQGAARKHPFELSGGMQQRGAIARALALGSPVLLMDEPFGALDPVNRIRLQDLLVEIWDQATPRKTVVFVTHDVEEALLLGNRVVVLGSSPGRVIADLAVPFARPRRRRELFANNEYQRLRDAIDAHYHADLLDRISADEEIGAAGEGI
jgi:NitT/TauT family transport system ATP-binding protein